MQRYIWDQGHTYGTSYGPGDKVCCHHDSLLGLPSDVSRVHTHSESLRGPETKDHVVGHQKTGLGGFVLVDNSHQDSGSDE